MKSEVSPADGKKHEPIQLIEVGNDHKFTLNEESLKKILLQDDIKDRSVAIISVAGDLRKGKSFLLNFFLRYLYAKVSKKLKIFQSSEMDESSEFNENFSIEEEMHPIG